MLQKLETLLTTVEQPLQSETIKDVIQFYCSDIESQEHLQTQLTLLHSGSCESITDISSTVNYLMSLTQVQREYFSEVIKIVQLILVLPAKIAVTMKEVLVHFKV